MSETPRIETPIGRSPLVAQTGLRSAASRVSAPDVWAFLLPAIAFLEVQVVGRLIISEVLALALLPWLLRFRDRLEVPRWLIILWASWLVSQVITDLVVGSAFTDWARGWAAIVFTMIDILAVAALAGTPRRARIFALGLATGGVLGYVFDPVPYAAVDPWKWAFAGPAAFALVAGLSGGVMLRRPWIVVLALAAFGWLNAFLLFRSLSGVALLTAVYLLAGILVRWRGGTHRPTIGRRISGVAFYGLAAIAVFVALNVAASMNLLGNAAKERFDGQSGAAAVQSGPPRGSPEPRTSARPPSSGAPAGSPGSPGASPIDTPPGGSAEPLTPSNPFAVLIGGRAEILTSPWAILDSPILGHGSWAKDPKYAVLQRETLNEFGVPVEYGQVDPDLIPTHSYLLGSWVWAGFAGGLFWFGVIGLALWLIGNLNVVRSGLSPLIVFSTSWLLWNIAFSPLGNEARLHAAFAIVLVLLGLRLARDLGTPGEWHGPRRGDAGPRPSSAP